MTYNKPFWRPGDGYEWETTLKHFLYGLVLAILSAGVTWTISYLEVAQIPPEYAIYTGLIIAILESIGNMVTHWNDEYEGQ